MNELSIVPANPTERRGALELLLIRMEESQRGEQLERLLQAEEIHANALDGLFIAKRGDQIVGACLAMIQPGRTAAVWPPELAANEREPVSTELLKATQRYLQFDKIVVAQALLETDAGVLADRLMAGRFTHVADLLFLVSDRRTWPDHPLSDPLQFESCPPQSFSRLARLIERSYEGTLDCPRLNGIRAMNDVMHGYQRTGVFDPNCWVIATAQGEDVGCVLLTDHAAEMQWEVMYMGLVPEARGRGWGGLMIRHAQWLAAQSKCSRLVLAVDAENEPALRAYASAGFVAWDRRSVFILLIERPNTNS